MSLRRGVVWRRRPLIFAAAPSTPQTPSSPMNQNQRKLRNRSRTLLLSCVLLAALLVWNHAGPWRSEDGRAPVRSLPSSGIRASNTASLSFPKFLPGAVERETLFPAHRGIAAFQGGGVRVGGLVRDQKPEHGDGRCDL
jgi:hypothetical protein